MYLFRCIEVYFFTKSFIFVSVFQSHFKLKPFQGAKICFLGFPEDEKRHMEEVLVENGGIVADAAESSHIVSNLFFMSIW